MPLRPIHNIALVLALIVFFFDASAKDKHPKQAPQDQIQVVAHIPVTGDTIVRFLTTQHYRRNYLYAEHESGKTVILIDVTNIGHPAVLAEMNDPSGASDALVDVAGDVALVATANHPKIEAPVAQTFRILNFADPLHPMVQQEFKGVTATARDDKRGLIFLANSDGIWILQQQFAMDPEEVKEWEHMVSAP